MNQMAILHEGTQDSKASPKPVLIVENSVTLNRIAILHEGIRDNKAPPKPVLIVENSVISKETAGVRSQTKTKIVTLVLTLRALTPMVTFPHMTGQFKKTSKTENTKDNDLDTHEIKEHFRVPVVPDERSNVTTVEKK